MSKMLDDYEVEQREDITLEDDIRMLGAVSYAGVYGRSKGHNRMLIDAPSWL